jgi:glutathione S-transferase
MKLYYSPGACSLSPHIVLREAGATFEIERVDLGAGKTAGGADFRQLNPKGYVPVLQLDNGEVLTEGAAIVQYIADLNPHANLAPKPATLERARLQEHLNYIAAEVHKGFSPLFSPDLDDKAREAAKKKLGQRLDYIEQVFGDDRQFLLGNTFSVADAYLFVVLGWSRHTGIALEKWPRLSAFHARIGAREKVKEALQAEGWA